MHRSLTLAALLLAATSSFAQVPAGNSQPQPAPLADTIPAPRDIAYPGTMRLDIDATDTRQAMFKVRQTIPVEASGRFTLLFPEWLPGNHAPRGQIEKLAGLKVTAGGRTLPWTRDPLDVFAFHVDLPSGTREIVAEFAFLSATDPAQGRVVMTPDMLNLQPNSMSLYPGGYFTRRIPVQMTVKYPDGWQAATALRPASTTGSTIRYETVDYDTLVDSPIFAGRNFRRETLAPNVFLNIVADEAKELAATPEQIAAHRRLVEQSVKLFGTRPFDHYDFLLSISNKLGDIGLEHHRSSENGVEPGYFTDWNAGPGERNLLPHELVHSWNGKYRRGADSWTPDFRAPIGNSMLWVYEGQTQFWGYVLGARSGLFTKQDTLDALASIAANLDNTPGRQWRPVIDTTLDPIITARRPKGWTSWQRSEDYYNEGLLIWLEADALIRKGTNGQRGMDDFARAFFSGREGDWGVRTYDFAELVRTLNTVYAYDWNAFLTQRLNERAERAPLRGLTEAGWKIVFTEEPTGFIKGLEKRTKATNLSYSIGASIANEGRVSAVTWDGPAFQAGLRVSDVVVAVDGRAYSADVIKAAITAAKSSRDPVRLLVKSGDSYREVPIRYTGGLRYPRLEKVAKGDTSLDRLLAAK